MKIEVSMGEVIDKITILEIKKERISNAGKLKYIVEELTELRGALLKENMLLSINTPQDLKTLLKEINVKLWEAEDILRVGLTQNLIQDRLECFLYTGSTQSNTLMNSLEVRTNLIGSECIYGTRDRIQRICRGLSSSDFGSRMTSIPAIMTILLVQN